MKPWSRFVVVWTSLLMLGGPVLAQEGYLLLHRDLNFAVERSVQKNPSPELHTAIRPYRADQVQQVMEDYSIPHFQKSFLFRNRFANNNPESGEPTTDFQWRLYPLFSLAGGYQAEPRSEVLNESSLGAGFQGSYRKKLFLNLNVQSFQATFPDFVQNQNAVRSSVSGGGYAYGTENGVHFKNNSGYVAYQPNSTFDFQLGYGRHFWGDGYRSLLLSDVAHNYGYGRISTNFWKIRYVNLFTNLQDVRFSGGDPSRFVDKYGTLHYLSYKATNWLTIGLFETVMWQGSDTLVDRGFDINYLNPVIFFRPVEFSTGSADNSLIGLNLKARVSPQIQFYGQVILDEFLLAEFRARTGWWGNKQGAQLGMKYFDALGVEGLVWQGEFNTVRPFTYTHGSIEQNYAHYNQPLAHPMGANFNEVLSFLTYQKEEVTVEARFQLAQGGLSDTINQGDDLYLSNITRNREYGHETGQGTAYDVLTLGLRWGYLIYAPTNLRLEADFTWRNQLLGTSRTNHYIVSLGIRTALWNRYTDF
ncbi:MAG: hypothetical protein ACFB10_23990 [Salibacteraceae bacterium]